MGLQFSLMGTAVAIMGWIVQRQQAGVLNVFFTARQLENGTAAFDIKSDVTDSLLEYITNMILLQPLPLSVLEAMPVPVGGGEEGVKDAHDNPNREAVIFWITVAVFLLSIVLILFIQIVNCCCCCCGDDKKKHGAPLTALQRAIEENENRNKLFIFRIAYILFFVIALAFLAASIFLVVVYFSNVGLVVDYLEFNSTSSSSQDSTSVSLLAGLHESFKQMDIFLTEGIDASRILTDTSVKGFIDRTNNTLSDESSKLIDKLITYLLIEGTLKKGEDLLSVTNDCITAVDTSKEEIASLNGEPEKLENEFDVTVRLYKAAFDGCNAVPDCLNAQDLLQYLKSPISTADLDTSVMDGFITSLDQTVADFTKQIIDAETYLKNIRSSKDNIISSVTSSLDISSVLKSLDDAWLEIQTQTTSLIKDFSGTIDTVESELPQYVQYIRIGYYVVGGLFLFMLVVAVLVATRLIYRAIRGRLLTDNSSNITAHSKWDTVVCGKCSVCCCSALFIPILLIYAAVIAVLFFALTTISGEGCIYLIKENATDKTDVVMNSVIAHEWQGFGGSDGVSSYVNTPPPRNMLEALTKTCNYAPDEPKGLFSALGYQNLLNVKAFVEAPEIKDGIAKGKTEVVKKIKELNIAANLPSGDDLDKQQDQIKTAVEGFDLQAIKEKLNSSKVDPEIFNDILKQMKELTEIFPNDAGFTSANDALANTIASVTALQPKFDLIEKSLNTIETTKEVIVPQTEDLVESFKSTIKASTTLEPEVEKEYDLLAEDLTKNMEVDGEKSFSELTQEVWACKEAGAAYDAVMGVTCGDEGAVNRLLGLTFILALNALFLAFLYFALFNLAFVQALQIRMFSSDGSDTDSSSAKIISGYENEGDTFYDYQ